MKIENKYDIGCVRVRQRGDCWNVDGDRGRSVPWTRFTQFTILNKILWDTRGLGGKIQAKPDYAWPEAWSNMSKSSQNRKKHSAIEKPKLDNAGKLMSIGMTWSSKNFEECAKKVGSANGIPNAVEAAKHLRENILTGAQGHTRRKTRHACIVDAHVSARKRNKETHIAERDSLR